MIDDPILATRALQEAIRDQLEEMERKRAAVERGIRCPISDKVMEHPVFAADGYTYERDAIEAWLASSGESPVTKQPLEHRNLVPNHQLRGEIECWKEYEEDTKSASLPETVAVPSAGRGGQDAMAAIEVESVALVRWTIEAGAGHRWERQWTRPRVRRVDLRAPRALAGGAAYDRAAAAVLVAAILLVAAIVCTPVFLAGARAAASVKCPSGPSEVSLSPPSVLEAAGVAPLKQRRRRGPNGAGADDPRRALERTRPRACPNGMLWEDLPKRAGRASTCVEGGL
eukprot:CAMPEP_0113720130 /NCGR_PEP_ID=MMETSP0038_2-20120614/36265_1 /TAXON_ID=2898 /ORGANISM="Cryptomonas paramecium" /LENGTH=284 /DNA_ID=CAMNT_0000648711 /DNA_START=543 /DNA_END=1395 /DNA_ORIENTATION=+ /assembly_acc=CAM_ASM_000170